MATITATEPLDLAIIGAGIYGICAANTYLALHPHANIKVLDSDDDVGGVWSASRLYPKFWSQTGIRVSGYPDKEFKPPPEAPEYHGLVEAKYLSRYLEDYVDGHEYDGRTLRARFVFRCWVQSVRKDADGVWAIEANVRDQPVTYRAAKVIIATGLSSIPNMPSLPGQDSFTGPIIHQKDVGRSGILTTRETDVAQHEHITVYGGSKSAADIAYAAATDTTAPRKVSWIIRTTGKGPLSLAGVKSPFAKYRNLTEVGSIRMSGCLSSANLYLPANSWREWFLYQTWVGDWLLDKVWARPVKEYQAEADFEGREGALEGFKGLRSEAEFRYRSGTIGLLQRDDFWDVVARRVQVYRDDIVGVKGDAVVLGDGREVRTDVLLCCTGWKADGFPFLAVEEAEGLGAPINLQEAEAVQRQKEHWASIDEEADRKVMARWPCLANVPAFKPEPVQATPYRLYNMTVPLEDHSSIAFLGIPLVPNSYHTALTQTLYAIAALDGTLDLPSKEQMAQNVAFTNAWCRRRYPVHGNMGHVLEFEMVAFTDRLLEELGLESHRLGQAERRTWGGWWRDLTDPCLASDYAGLVDEYRRKYMA
ncbi:hypothetical protein LTR36_009599 [Oleoguttula mirabilis]|uniref:L-ornithine N(5)-monooxygenase [NAD(P)H] n=1 Tax=Oleoguttula mirabilis TaxID=1507867 RepID=A0AAV9J5N1_9PEZI|nr:hypothetical protein LTR36_009599 [Oleoguttula mirabilis]